MKDLLTVNEFSQLSGIEKTTLRYYDEIGLFSPAKRNSENNYRYYSPEQLIALNFITVFSELNIPLKTISAVEKERTPETVFEFLKQQEKQMDMEMKRLRERYSIIHTRSELIWHGLQLKQQLNGNDEVGKEASIGICVSPIDEYAYILGPPTSFGEDESFVGPFARFCQQAEELRINLSFPIGGYHATPESFFGSPSKPDHFFSMDPTGNRKVSAGKYLKGFVRGFYGELGDVPMRMAAYARENGLTLSGPVYTVYLHDEICVNDPSQYLTQVFVAVSQ